MKSVFVSYVFEDKAYKETIEKWALDELLGNVKITAEKDDVRASGDNAIRNQLSPLLTGAAAVIALIGDDTHNHEWVHYEINHALSNHKKVIPVRIPNTTGAPPNVIKKKELVDFEPDAIKQAIED